MQDQSRRVDAGEPENSANAPGVRAPVKRDSSASGPPFDPDATLVDLALPPSDQQAPAAQAPRSTGAGAPRVPSSSTPVLQTGDVLGGRYEILQLLGEGGMGAVYKAMDREVDRTVALKLIRPELASNRNTLARFKQELLTAHQVTHKNVIRIYDIAEADGVKFITMEYVEGSDLRHILID